MAIKNDRPPGEKKVTIINSWHNPSITVKYFFYGVLKDEASSHLVCFKKSDRCVHPNNRKRLKPVTENVDKAEKSHRPNRFDLFLFIGLIYFFLSIRLILFSRRRIDRQAHDSSIQRVGFRWISKFDLSMVSDYRSVTSVD